MPGGREKRRGFKRFLGVTLTLGFAAAACLLLMGNAAIYENNRNIQAMGKQIQNSIVAVNSAKKELAETADLELSLIHIWGRGYNHCVYLYRLGQRDMPCGRKACNYRYCSGQLLYGARTARGRDQQQD